MRLICLHCLRMTHAHHDIERTYRYNTAGPTYALKGRMSSSLQLSALSILCKAHPTGVRPHEIVNSLHTQGSTITLWHKVLPDKGSRFEYTPGRVVALTANPIEGASLPGPTLGGPRLDTLAAIRAKPAECWNAGSRAPTLLLIDLGRKWTNAANFDSR